METLAAIAALVCAGFLLGVFCTRLVYKVLRRIRARRAITINPRDALQVAAKYASDGILIQDLEGHVEWMNPAYTKITGYHLDELQGKKPQSFLFPANKTPSPDQIAAFRYDPESEEFNNLQIMRNRRKDGTEFWNQMNLALAEVSEGLPAKVVLVCRDVSKQVQREESLRIAERQLTAETERDSLTNVANRVKLSSFLEEALRVSQIEGGRVGLIALDLDRFKQINDEIGHAAGDAVLVHASTIMSNAVSVDDLVCRIGGDEFIIICPGVRGFSDLKQIGTQILHETRQPLLWEGHEISFGTSIGVVLSEDGQNDIDELLRQADMALYAAKEDGRGQIVCFDEQFKARTLERKHEGIALKTSLHEEAFEMEFQPIVDATTLEPCGLESLIRWQHPSRGLLPPAAFFDMAEEHDMMGALDEIAIRKSLDAVVTLHSLGKTGLTVGINISPTTLARPDFVDHLKWELDARNIAPESIVVEVLESTIIDQGDEGAALTIAALSDAGIAIALDDFGTGYAGLAHLARLKLDFVKIDKSLIADLLENKAERTISEAIVDLCLLLGRKVVAEGVETAEQASVLREMGVSVFQGHGIANPMSMQEALDWIENGHEPAFDRSVFELRYKKRG